MKVYTYPATFERGKDMIGVYFRDIPGVTSGGDSMDDAVLQAKEALEFYLEDRLENRLSIPKPSEPDQVELAPNEFVCMVSVEMPTPTENRGHRTIDIPEWADQTAHARGIDLTQFIMDTLEKEFAEKK